MYSDSVVNEYCIDLYVKYMINSKPTNYDLYTKLCCFSPYDAKNPFLAQITVNRELHKGGDRSCLHVELDISDSKMRYEAGKFS